VTYLVDFRFRILHTVPKIFPHFTFRILQFYQHPIEKDGRFGHIWLAHTPLKSTHQPVIWRKICFRLQKPITFDVY